MDYDISHSYMLLQSVTRNLDTTYLGVVSVSLLFSFLKSGDDVGAYAGLATDSTPLGFEYMTPASTHISLTGHVSLYQSLLFRTSVLMTR
jgi:hypothetical protein